MTEPTKRKQYAILNAAYYHGNNIKTVLTIAIMVEVAVALIVGTIKLASA